MTTKAILDRLLLTSAQRAALAREAAIYAHDSTHYAALKAGMRGGAS